MSSSSSIDGLDYRTSEPVRITYAEGLITSIEPLCDEEARLCGPLPFLGPGFCDLQVNGAVGVDFNALEPGGAARVAEWLLAHGTTSFLAAIITNSEERLCANLRALAAELDASAPDSALRRGCLGVHLEGPFLSRLEGFRGAHEAALMRDPDLALFARWQAAAGGRVRAVTLAPELPGSAEFIRAVAAQGVLVAVGHSAADGAQLAAAAAAGARLATHVGNGAPALLPRHPNPIWEQLAADGLCASLIVDGHHLPDSVLRVALRAKRGFGGCVLVSDSVAVAGLAPGAHSAAVGGSVVLTESGRLHLASDPRLLAGSAISLERAVAHVAFTPGLLPGPWRAALAEAWAMASTRPAALARLPQAAGLRVGAPADLVLFVAAAGGGAGGAGGAGGGGGDGAAPRGLRIQETIKGGAVVFTALASS